MPQLTQIWAEVRAPSSNPAMVRLARRRRGGQGVKRMARQLQRRLGPTEEADGRGRRRRECRRRRMGWERRWHERLLLLLLILD